MWLWGYAFVLCVLGAGLYTGECGEYRFGGGVNCEVPTLGCEGNYATVVGLGLADMWDHLTPLY